jgi:hypothetical protein
LNVRLCDHAPWQCDTTQPIRPNSGSISVSGRCCSIPHTIPTRHTETVISFLGPSYDIYQGSGLWIMTLWWWLPGYRRLTRISLQRASVHWFPVGTGAGVVIM